MPGKLSGYGLFPISFLNISMNLDRSICSAGSCVAHLAHGSLESLFRGLPCLVTAGVILPKERRRRGSTSLLCFDLVVTASLGFSGWNVWVQVPRGSQSSGPTFPGSPAV